ncbi:hypothetical protein EDB84DRAFT_983691 [Lactarius hengduanensis]|nr:hypothetical protein EDB84DRAFT_983691 [Lactarius hengduanensis]
MEWHPNGPVYTPHIYAANGHLLGGRRVPNAPPLATKPGNSRISTLVRISDSVNERYCLSLHDASATRPKIYTPWPSVREGIGTDLRLACSFRRGRGQRVGDNVPCSEQTNSRTFLLGSSLLLLQGLFHVGGSGGDAVTHMMHHLRERAGAGDTLRARAAPGLHSHRSGSHVRP